MGSRRSVSLLAVALALALAWAAAVMADDDHARARAAREAGLIVSLQAILDRVQADFIGSPGEVEREEDEGPWTYKVKLLTPAGASLKLENDARAVRPL